MHPLSQNPKISILMATHNGDRYLDAAIKSILSQSGYNNWEIVIVDDKSTDRSFQIAKTHALKEPRIKCYQNKTRLHCSSTYAKALSLATGEICGILDGDDFLEKNAISVIARAYIKNPGLSYIYTQSWWCDHRLKKEIKGISKLPINGLLVDESSGQHCFSHWRTFRTELRNEGEIFPPGLTSAVDKAMGYRLEEIGNGGFLDIPLYLYRRNPNGISKTKNRPNNSEGYTNQRWFVIEEAKKRRQELNLKTFPIIKVTTC